MIAYPLPQQAIVSSPFSPRRWHPILHKYLPHSGADLIAPVGTPVLSCIKGKVVIAGWYYGYGYAVIVENEEVQCLYGHLSKVIVRKGQTVSIKQLVGEVGSSGYSTGPHLH